MTRLIGLTGGIGAGKSTALAAFGRLGAMTLSTDELAHELIDEEVLRELIAERWGDRVLREGHVDRDQVARIVFDHPEQLDWLERELHPRIGARMLAWAEAIPDQVRAAVVEVPLLFEAGMEGLFDVTVAVIAADDVRAGRLATSGRPAPGSRESRQLGQDEKASRADHTIANDGSMDALEQRVAEVLEQVTGAPR